jgi:TatD DNase family protein
MFVDSHCHLDDKRFSDDLDATLERAAAAGVTRILTIGTGDGPPELDRAVRLAERYEQISATIGVHPHEAAKVTPETYASLRLLGRHPKVVALGEIGLDYHYDFSPRETQREVFVRQLELARELDLPVTIHTREAWEDTVSILRDHWSGPGVMHCFTGNPDQAEAALAMGFYLSYGGVVTFKTADNVRESARMTPDDRLLIETDAPYLAPIPHRGKRNEPAMMLRTAEKLAEIRGTTTSRIGEITSANFDRLCLRPRNETRYTGGFDGN